MGCAPFSSKSGVVSERYSDCTEPSTFAFPNFGALSLSRQSISRNQTSALVVTEPTEESVGNSLMTTNEGQECDENRLDSDDIELLTSLDKRTRSFPVAPAILGPTGTPCLMKPMLPPGGSLTQLKEMEYELMMLYNTIQSHKESSRYIVGFHGTFRCESHVCVAMEWMEGSLAQIVEWKVKIAEKILALLIKPVLRGLDYLHRQLHFTHGNLQLSNVFFDRNGCIKLSELRSSSKIVEATTGGREDIFSMVYMSPERLLEGQLSFASDVWSVGIIALELAQGYLPYSLTEQDDKAITYGKMLEYFRNRGSPTLAQKSEVVEAGEGHDYSDCFESMISLCLWMNPQQRLTARQLLQHDWIMVSTMSEELFDESVLHSWLCSVMRLSDVATEEALVS